MSWGNTSEKLDPNVTKLIVTPAITTLRYGSADVGKGEITKNREPENTMPNLAREAFVLDDMTSLLN